MKILNWIILFSCFILVDIFVHDFPSFDYKNDCFHQIFDKDITNEEIISFNCFNEFWTTGWYYEITFLCNKQCFLELFSFEYNALEYSRIGKKTKILSSNFLYNDFKKQLKKYHNGKKTIIIYHLLDDNGYYRKKLLYEPDSQLCMFVTYKL